MLYNLNWLQEGAPFPPACEQKRVERYIQNAVIFDSDQFADQRFRHRDESAVVYSTTTGLYEACLSRIAKVIGNFEDIISVPVLMNYQKFISLKMADLVAGENPIIAGMDDNENRKLKWVIDNTNFFEKLYSIIIDLSRYGDCPIRLYKDEYTGQYDFTIWEASNWYPIVSNDGTNRIQGHVLTWFERINPTGSATEKAEFNLHAQIFNVHKPSEYTHKVFYCGSSKLTIGKLISDTVVKTGFDICPVLHLKPYAVSGTVYGYDDYVPLDSLMTEIITRVSQISAILDKHADPSMTGPLTMLTKDTKSGQFVFQHAKFYGITDEATPPSYLTWDGQLEAAFQQLEFLINQLYILSEMGAALVGSNNGSSTAVSGTAMRFKLVNPLAKARRVSNSLTVPLRKLLSVIGSATPDIDTTLEEPVGFDTELPFGHISIEWNDGLPNDPREQLEIAMLASGEDKLLPLVNVLVDYLDKSPAEAVELVKAIREEQQLQVKQTGVNPNAKGDNGLGQFTAATNKASAGELNE